MIELLRDGAVRKTFEESKLHQRKLLLRQNAQRVAHVLLPLHCVDMLVAASAGIGNGEKILGRKTAFTAAPLDVDTPVARDLKHPGDGRRSAAIVEMRLLPNRFHHVLREILGRRRSEPKADELRLHAWPKMIEQKRECPVIAGCADGREQIVEFALRRRHTAGTGAIIDMSPKGQVHGVPRPKSLGAFKFGR
jgi:hypothetical protein